MHKYWYIDYNAEGGADALCAICEKVLNGHMPTAAKTWVYAQKVVPFSKLSNHQADIEARAKAAAKADGDSYEAPVRPITIGDALLRLAEKAIESSTVK